MQLLRWSSDEARKLYAQIGAGAQASLLESAVETPIDCIRSHTLVTAGAARPSAGAVTVAAGAAGPWSAGAETHAAVREAGEAVQHGAALVEAAHDVRGALPTVDELPELDDDEIHGRISAVAEQLRTAAAKADADLAQDPGSGSGSGSD